LAIVFGCGGNIENKRKPGAKAPGFCRLSAPTDRTAKKLNGKLPKRNEIIKHRPYGRYFDKVLASAAGVCYTGNSIQKE
jgi:hypothetical protein